MPLIESLIVKHGQVVARVLVEKDEIVLHNQKLPYFEGKRWRALTNMTLVDGEDWHPGPHGDLVRLVEVVVRPVDEHPPPSWPKTKRRGAKRPRSA